jgi:hypothetical protein
VVKTPLCEQVMGGGILSPERQKILDEQRERTPPWGCWARGVLHTRYVFPTYSVQLGTDNEQQWINLSNSSGRVLVYTFRTERQKKLDEQRETTPPWGCWARGVPRTREVLLHLLRPTRDRQ